MRRRLVAAFVSLAIAVIVLFGVPRGFVVAQLVESERQGAVDKSADVAALVVSDAVEDGDPVSPAVLEGLLGDGEVLEYRSADGSAVVVPQGAEPTGADGVSAQRAVADGGTLTVGYSDSELRGDVVRTVTPVVLLALLLVVLAGLAGWLAASRLARPFAELAGVAEEFGRGRLETEVPRYAIAEADAIGRALHEASESLQRMVRREREVSDYASHDLRTPITALRLTLEDLVLWPSTPPDVAQELTRILAEVDRFASAVTTLVDAPSAAPAQPAQLVDVAAVVREAARDRPADGAGGAVHVEPGTPVLARLPLRTARRAVDMLLEHAATGSEGPVVAKVGDATGYVVVALRGSVSGPERSHDAVWDQAVGLAVQLGGRLTRTRNDADATWTLLLPKEHGLGADGIE